MPSPFSGIIQDLRARDSKATTQQDVMMRMIEQQRRAQEAERFRLWITQYQNQNSPQAVAEQRRREAWNKKLQLQDADMKYVLSIDPNKIDAYYRPYLEQTKQNLLSPNADPNVAARFIAMYRPSGLKYYFRDTVDAAGKPITVAVGIDPMTPRTLGPMTSPGFGGGSSGSPIGGGGGTRPAVAAPTLPARMMRPKTRVEKLADEFMPPAGDKPPDLPGVEAPSLPEVPE